MERARAGVVEHNGEAVARQALGNRPAYTSGRSSDNRVSTHGRQ
jgi:hypothetical protein